MNFDGASVLAFESRRAAEIGELIRINGGEPFVAPALTEAPLAENSAVFAFADRLYAGELDMVIFLTGVGTRLMGKVLAEREPGTRLTEALRQVAVVARGPKPSAVLREWNVPVTVAVPEPNTWRELLQVVEQRSEQSVAVQEYGRTNQELIAGLAAQGRTVMNVPVYQWKLPDDTSRLAEAVQGLVARRFAAAVFTTGVQIDHLLEFAATIQAANHAVKALQNMFVASIGPDCTEALRSHGIDPNVEPSHPKMGVLIREAAQAFAVRVKS